MYLVVFDYMQLSPLNMTFCSSSCWMSSITPPLACQITHVWDILWFTAWVTQAEKSAPYCEESVPNYWTGARKEKKAPDPDCPNGLRPWLYTLQRWIRLTIPALTYNPSKEVYILHSCSYLWPWNIDGYLICSQVWMLRFSLPKSYIALH